jgi:WD40 repeat protein
MKLWDAKSGRALRVLDGKPVAITFSPDGRILAADTKELRESPWRRHEYLSIGVMIELWDPKNGRKLHAIGSHSDSIQALAFSPDGRTLASGSEDGWIKIWDLAGGRELHAFNGHPRGVWSVAYSPDGLTLASAGSDKMIKLWTLVSGRELCALAGHSDRVRSVAYSPNGRMLASGSDDGTIQLWDTAAISE